MVKPAREKSPSKSGGSPPEAQSLPSVRRRKAVASVESWDRKAPPLAPDRGFPGVNFMGVELETAPEVIVPRLETSLIVEEALKLMQAGPERPTVFDMCCGSGNISVVLALRFPSARIVACDLSEHAVAVTRRNVARHDLGDRVAVVQGDLFAGIDTRIFAGAVDVVVANPPYISSSRLDGDRAGLLDSEPREAFDAGPYGISLHQRLVAESPHFLKPGGWLALEFGHGQDRLVSGLVARSRAYGATRLADDGEGVPRVALAQKKAEDGTT